MDFSGGEPCVSPRGTRLFSSQVAPLLFPSQDLLPSPSPSCGLWPFLKGGTASRSSGRQVSSDCFLGLLPPGSARRSRGEGAGGRRPGDAGLQEGWDSVCPLTCLGDGMFLRRRGGTPPCVFWQAPGPLHKRSANTLHPPSAFFSLSQAQLCLNPCVTHPAGWGGLPQAALRRPTAPCGLRERRHSLTTCRLDRGARGSGLGCAPCSAPCPARPLALCLKEGTG